MSSSAQAPQDLRSLHQIGRFTDYVVIERNKRIGCEHDLVRICSSERRSFSDGIPHRQLPQRKIEIKFFRDARRDGFEFESSLSKQRGPSGRARCQHE